MTKMIMMQTELNHKNESICKRTEIIKVDKTIDEIFTSLGCTEQKIADIKMNRFKPVAKV